MSSTAEVLPIIRSQFSKLRLPSPHDSVFNDECVYSFDSPFSDTGLYVNLVTWQGFGKEYLQKDISKGGKLYLHEKFSQIPKDCASLTIDASSEDPEYVMVSKAENVGKTATAPTPSKMAIGVPGGFMAEEKYEIIKEYSVVVVDDTKDGGLVRLPYPNPELPEFVSNIIEAIIAHSGMKSKMSVDTWEASQDKIVSKYAANLEQLNTGKKISQDPSTWKCEMSGDTHNLWLNLSTGFIGGGRKNFDGSGGSGAALKHYEETGRKYPLCVKLGTITQHGADVWSYAADEDDLVIDPFLAQHLSHWGIDIMKLEKTDKTLSEMEVDMNMKYDWSRLLDGGESMTLLYGAGKVGLRNIGSSCYMNSIMQPLLHLPEVQERYLGRRAEILDSCPATDPSSDFATQMSKLAHGLLSDRYAKLPTDSTAVMSDKEGDADASILEKYVVAPRMFKQVVGKGHPEFSSSRQQDVHEYFLHILDFMASAEKRFLPRIGDGSGKTTASLFEYSIEDRYECPESGQVKYKVERGNWSLDLKIPLDKATNKEAVDLVQERKKQKLSPSNTSPKASSDDEDLRLSVPFEECIASYFAPSPCEMINPSVSTTRNIVASKTARIKSFPKYLMVKMGRYMMGPNWVPVKIDADVTLPENLDLSAFRGTGIKEGEAPMPESSNAPSSSSSSATPSSAVAVAPTVEFDEGLVAQLVSMGFSEWGSKKAAMVSSDPDRAMAWIFEHMEDPDFNDPIVPAAIAPGNQKNASGSSDPPSESIEMIVSMGYSRDVAKAALLANNNDLERSLDWIFSHTDDLDAAVAAVTSNSTTSQAASSTSTSSTLSSSSASPEPLDDGHGQYSLIAIISHVGRNTEHGHYICHMKNGDGTWSLFNDEKVALANRPPFNCGFMYLYRRND